MLNGRVAKSKTFSQDEITTMRELLYMQIPTKDIAQHFNTKPSLVFKTVNGWHRHPLKPIAFEKRK